jgi:hypothetical protein
MVFMLLFMTCTSYDLTFDSWWITCIFFVSSYIHFSCWCWYVHDAFCVAHVVCSQNNMALYMMHCKVHGIYVIVHDMHVIWSVVWFMDDNMYLFQSVVSTNIHLSTIHTLLVLICAWCILCGARCVC